MMCSQIEFAQFMKSELPDLEDDLPQIEANSPKWTRLKLIGDKPGATSVSCKLTVSQNYASGCYKDFKNDRSGTWSVHFNRGQSSSGLRKGKVEQRRALDRMKQETIAIQKAAAKRAYAIYENAKTPVNSLYLEDGKVEHHEFFRQSGRQLVAPIQNIGGAITSLQFINEKGEKRFLKGGEINGCFGLLGGDFMKALSTAELLAIAEGGRTAASIHQATGLPVAVGYSAGNLQAVALAIKQKYPAIKLIICADDDFETPGNPGLTKAHGAAAAVDANVVKPDFSSNGGKGTDFNDLAVSEGLEAVREVFERLVPDLQKNQPSRANTNQARRKTKYEVMIAAFLRLGSMNTFQAKKEYGDTCLRSSVRDLFRKYQIEFGREKEKAINQADRAVMVTRYMVTQRKRMEAVLAKLRLARGENGG